MSSIYPLLIISCFSLLVLFNILGRRRGRKLPPGPPGLPVIGNIFDIPKGGHEWLAYQMLGKAYSALNIPFE